jgi:hypothetical protein
VAVGQVVQVQTLTVLVVAIRHLVRLQVLVAVLELALADRVFLEVLAVVRL